MLTSTLLRVKALVLVLGAGAAAACTVESTPPPNDASAAQPAGQRAGSPECGAQQDQCMARCKSAAADEASRQPCYNRCMHDSQACSGGGW